LEPGEKTVICLVRKKEKKNETKESEKTVSGETVGFPGKETPEIVNPSLREKKQSGEASLFPKIGGTGRIRVKSWSFLSARKAEADTRKKGEGARV